jgi:Preprotein translocase subunit SecB
MQHRGEIMQDKDGIRSVLKLEKLVFDKIEFKRLGFKNDKEIELRIRSNISQKQGADIYRITLVLNGDKPEEYSFEISLTGFFAIEDCPDITQELKDDLVSKNAVAILMPYLRSEVSLLTAQPGMECVVLPAFNINKMLEE